ncbi:hypothetical protein DPM33_22665 [Mesorhizobium hawassense]|uniref:Uncharacterized protein n=1 Tax=Mesorhizobium hawassense TaxID=1209954 RepID=A0A330HJB3_9HYPH|nr:hypothetical protein DPM33_22665 [Mesorhizobium hawassense]
MPFRDFYGDATVPFGSLPSLAAQVAALQQIEGVSEGSRDFLVRLSDLISYAMQRGKSIEALAD